MADHNSFTLKPIGASGSPARMLQDLPEEIVNAFVIGIATDGAAIRQMLEILRLLDKSGYEIVLKRREGDHDWRHGL